MLMVHSHQLARHVVFVSFLPIFLQCASDEMHALLQQLRQVVVTGVVGGSDLVKIQEQLGPKGAPIAMGSH